MPHLHHLYSGAVVTRSERLAGGMSAELWKISLEHSEGESIVVARFPGSDIQQFLPNAAEYEFRILDALTRSEVCAPRPLALDTNGEFLLLEFMDGIASAAPKESDCYISEFASALASIHKTPLTDFDFLLETRLSFEPRRTELNADLREPEIVARLVEAGLRDEGVDVLRHGDFWPGNVLWEEGRVSGVIDWENALRGPAIADLAISRLDVAWILGMDAADEFTARYLEVNAIDTRFLPYWDLRASLRPMANLEEWAAPYAPLGRPDITGRHLKSTLDEFIDQALRAYA